MLRQRPVCQDCRPVILFTLSAGDCASYALIFITSCAASAALTLMFWLSLARTDRFILLVQRPPEIVVRSLLS